MREVPWSQNMAQIALHKSAYLSSLLLSAENKASEKFNTIRKDLEESQGHSLLTVCKHFLCFLPQKILVTRQSRQSETEKTTRTQGKGFSVAVLFPLNPLTHNPDL